VVLLQAFEKDSSGRHVSIWSGALPFEWRHQEVYGTERTIGPHQDVNVCSVAEDKWLALHPVVRPFNIQLERRTESAPIDLVLHFQARSSEADSKVVAIRITWDGKWDAGDTEMGRHLVIEEQAALGSEGR
jgi:hypothetical protein